MPPRLHLARRRTGAELVPGLPGRAAPDCRATVPLLQIGCRSAMVLTVVMLPGSWVALPYLFLVVVLAAIAVVDLRIWLIPYWMPWAGAAVGLVLISAVSIGIGAPGQIVRGRGRRHRHVPALLPAVHRRARQAGVRRRPSGPAARAVPGVDAPDPAGLRAAVRRGARTGHGTCIALVARGDSRFPFGPALSLGAMAAVWLHEPILARPRLTDRPRPPDRLSP